LKVVGNLISRIRGNKFQPKGVVILGNGQLKIFSRVPHKYLIQ